MQFVEDTISIKDTIIKYGSSSYYPTTDTFTIKGWIGSYIKKIGNRLYFATLRDLYCNNFQLEDKRESFLLKSCDTLKNCVQIKSHITVKKQPKKSSQKFQSNQQQEYEFVLNNLIMLNRASIKPSQLIDQ